MKSPVTTRAGLFFWLNVAVIQQTSTVYYCIIHYQQRIKMLKMKHILENKSIEQEYMLFQLAPTQYYNRIVDLSNIWIMGYENKFKKLFEQPQEDYLQDYAESEDEWFKLYLQKEGAENHPYYGEVFDIRNYKDMKLMRTILEAAE